MPKRRNPFGDPFATQMKTHVGQREVNFGVNKDKNMKVVYEKTLAMLYEGQRSLAHTNGQQDTNGHGVNGLAMNGHDMNGHGINGHGVNGHGINGHGVNGHGINGHGVNGHGVNGHGINGHDMNGHGMNGHDMNGHGINGHGVNGHGINGHTVNGHSMNGHDVDGQMTNGGHHMNGHHPVVAPNGQLLNGITPQTNGQPNGHLSHNGHSAHHHGPSHKGGDMEVDAMVTDGPQLVSGQSFLDSNCRLVHSQPNGAGDASSCHNNNAVQSRPLCVMCKRKNRQAKTHCHFCEKYLCADCTSQCDNCQDSFCVLCTSVNYDERYERMFCVSCS